MRSLHPPTGISMVDFEKICYFVIHLDEGNFTGDKVPVHVRGVGLNWLAIPPSETL